MIQFIIPVVIILVALIIILFVIVRHFPQAASIDLESLPAEQEAAMKAALMERRLKRKLHEIKNRLLPVLRRSRQAVVGMFEGMHRRVSMLEQRYRVKPHAMNSAQQEDIRQKVRQLLEEAAASMEQEKYSEAEGKYIEVLSWDHKNLDAYLALAGVYFTKREFNQAKETYQFLFKLLQSQKSGEESVSKFSTPLTETEIAEAHYDFAQCLQILQDYKGASKQIEINLARDAKNPKYLDKLVELSILIKDRKTARETLDRLKEVNPDNQKLSSFEEKIRQM
jgi:tetratricopeptide (TPR) repeat protein